MVTTWILISEFAFVWVFIGLLSYAKYLGYVAYSEPQMLVPLYHPSDLLPVRIFCIWLTIMGPIGWLLQIREETIFVWRVKTAVEILELRHGLLYK